MILHRILVPFWTLVAFILIAAPSVSVVEAMNKAELIDAIASNADLSKADAKRAVDSFFDIFVDLAEDWSRGNGGKKDKKRAPAAIEFDDFGIFVFCDNKDNDCDSLITGIPEICNGQDDDCDGIVDGLDNDCDGDGLSDDVDVKMYFIPTGDTSEAMYARYAFGTIRDLTAEMAFAIREGGRTVGAGQVTERQLQLNPLSLDSCLTEMYDMKLDGHGHVTVLKLRDGIEDESLLHLVSRCLSPTDDHVPLKPTNNFFRTQKTLVPKVEPDMVIQFENRVKLTMKVMTSVRKRGDSVAKVIHDANFINGTDLFVRKRPGRIKFFNEEKVVSDEDIEMERLALTVLQDALREAVMEGDNVCLAGFGSFSISKRAARTGRNPQTGKEIKIAAKTVVKFKAGKALKDAVN